MRNRRPILEDALQEKIINKDLSALELIKLIQKDKQTKLNSVDNNGKSFLNHALEVGFKEVADELFLLLIKDENIIFGNDMQGQTCLFLAAKQGYTDIVESIMNQSSSHQLNRTELGYKIWLEKDNRGYSPLHVASENHQNMVVNLLVNLLLKDINGINHINNINEDGNTPLHLACIDKAFPFNEKLINILIQKNADLNVTNVKGQTPLQLIVSFSFDKQCNLFAILGDKQEIFLQAYREHVKKNRDNEELTNNYCQLIKFRDNILYHLAKDGYEKKVAASLNSDTSKIVSIHSDNEIPSFILERQMMDILNDSDEESVTSSSQMETKKSLDSYQVLIKDQNTIKKIIADTEAYLTNLSARPTNLISHRTLIGIGTSVLGLGFIALEIWLVMMQHKYDALHKSTHGTSDPHDDEYFSKSLNFEMGSIFVGIGGAISTLASTVWAVASTGSILKQVSYDEWHGFVNTMRTNLLEKLQYIENLDMKSGAQDEKYLPIDSTLLRDLENNLAAFECDKKTIPELVDMVTSLDTILVQIQKSMRITNKPFTLFHQPSTAASSTSNMSLSSEATPMLRGNR